MGVSVMEKKLYHFIGGEFKEGKGERFGKVYKPSTGEVLGLCPFATEAEVDETVEKAKSALNEWKKMPAPRRAEVFHRFRNMVVEQIDYLADLIGLESGKTISDAKGEISRGIESIDMAINAPHLLKGEYSVNVGGHINAYSMRQPLGVVAAISPFNFPFMVPAAMTAMALAVGNTVILKPSEKVPNTAMYMSELWKKAGIPDGVWSVINGDKLAVDRLLRHPDIAGVTFVGSTRVAEYVYEEANRHHKRVAAFGGGKNHMIIMPDADMDQAVNAFVGAGFGAASQRCMALSVAVPVGKKTAEIFTEKLKKRVEQLKVGMYNDKTVDFGALISKEAKENVLRSINESIEEGGRILVDGRNPKVDHPNGFYLGPTLIDQVTLDMKIYREEVFGPARIIVRTNTLEEAIELINNHEYGNGVTIFTESGAAARKFTEDIEVGMVGVNVPIPIPVGYHNFAGWKRSRFGEGYMFGPENARFFTKLKTISERWFGTQKQENAEISFDFPSNS